MPHTTIELGGRAAAAASLPSNHNRPWTREQEDQALEMFRSGVSVDSVASAMGRTTGAINARLGLLLGVAYPDTPTQFRSRGGAIWTICRDCGRQWADDRGGFKPHEDAPAVAKARAVLSASCAPKQTAP